MDAQRPINVTGEVRCKGSQQYPYQEAVFLHCEAAHFLEDHMYQFHEFVIIPAYISRHPWTSDQTLHALVKPDRVYTAQSSCSNNLQVNLWAARL